MPCCLRRRGHQRRRSAVVEMSSRPRLAQSRRDIETLRRIAAVVMKGQPSLGGKRRQLTAERRSLGCARAIMDLEFGTAAAQFRGHRHDRRDADAPGDQQVPFRRRIDREIIARHRHIHDVAGPHILVQIPRPAAAPILAQHRDAIPPALGSVVPQGIPPQQATGPQFDMRARRKPRQVAAARIDQLIAVDGFGEVGDRSDAQLHGPGLLQILPVLGKDRADR